MEETQKPKKSLLAEFAESIILAVILALIIRLFIIEPFYIPSESMEPTLSVGDRIIVSKFTYKIGESLPHRGDVIVFRFPLDTSRNFVKRVVALGGETLTVRDSRLYIDGNYVPEGYLPEGLEFDDYGPVRVPEGTLWVMGDNRNDSDDSRRWGALDEDLIVGKSILIYWPLDRMDMLH
ncbi:MAG TPA: signal peptidase I [Clostridia bacterium]|nr:signal peptidase I [Clostridia bacterium]